jgi:hypothetical protein
MDEEDSGIFHCGVIYWHNPLFGCGNFCQEVLGLEVMAFMDDLLELVPILKESREK